MRVVPSRRKHKRHYLRQIGRSVAFVSDSHISSKCCALNPGPHGIFHTTLCDDVLNGKQFIASFLTCS